MADASLAYLGLKQPGVTAVHSEIWGKSWPNLFSFLSCQILLLCQSHSHPGIRTKCCLPCCDVVASWHSLLFKCGSSRPLALHLILCYYTTPTPILLSKMENSCRNLWFPYKAHTENQPAFSCKCRAVVFLRYLGIGCQSWKWRCSWADCIPGVFVGNAWKNRLCIAPKLM